MALREQAREATSEHHRDDVLVGHLRRHHGANGLAVAQHRDPIGDPSNLVHAVRDIEHQLALLGIPAGHLEQPVHVSGYERGGRLVQDQDVGLAGQRLGDLDELLIGHGHGPDGPVRR